MPALPEPANGTFKGDSFYYLAAQNLLNYYFYYQTIGLGLVNEAYHWNAWIAVVNSGGASNYSADSIQLICNEQSATVDCNFVYTYTNSLYNDLLFEFKQVGAPYTGEELIYQKTADGADLVWVQSLEDFTSQSGASCDLSTPLNLQGHTSIPINVCGPAVGMPGGSLSFTTYRGTQNFSFPGFSEFSALLSNPINGSTAGYLGSLGFENMQYKVLLCDTLVEIGSTIIGASGFDNIDTQTVVPFALGIGKIWTTNGIPTVIYSTYSDFISGSQFQNSRR